MKSLKLKTILLSALLSITSVANAAFITIDEAGLDAVFSQATFGNDIVDIRIGTAIEHVNGNLLDLDSAAKWNDLTSNHYGSANTVNFWFLDDLSWCGNINNNYVGCGETPGNDFVVESIFAAGPAGPELLAHELAHNLGLPHRNGAGNLLDPFINGGTNLNANEVSQILASPLVQTDANGRRFIDILPILIVEQLTGPKPISEPAIWGLMLLAFGLMARRKKV